MNKNEKFVTPLVAISSVVLLHQDNLLINGVQSLESKSFTAMTTDGVMVIIAYKL
jgi:hypothetical protein